MSSSPSVDQAVSGEQLLKDVSTQLIEEKWTRTTIENYSKRNFVLLDDIIETAEKEGVAEQLREISIEHLNKSTKSIIALYLAGILTYEQEIIDDSYILQIINLFKENKKWQVVEYLADKILTYGENKFALTTLEDCYQNTNNDIELLNIWERLSKIDYENGEIPRKLAMHYEKDENEESEEEAVFYYKMALKRFSKNQTIKAVEDIWIRLADSIPDKIDFFYQIGDEVSRYQPDKAAMFLALLLPYYQDKNDHNTCIDILKKILTATPKDKTVREQLIKNLQNKYEDHSQLEEYTKKSGLTKQDANLKMALEKFERYIVFDRGNFVYHRSWGIGRIVDCKEDSFVIDFESKKNHTMSLKIALTSLKTLSEDHIWIQKKKDPDLFKQDDAEGIKIALTAIFKSYNNQATMKEIKKEMTEIIPLTSWTKWWNKAKGVMKTSSIFGNSPAKRDLYFLRDKPLTFEEEAHSNFFATANFDTKLSTISDYLKHSEDIDSEGFQQMLNSFVEIANNKTNIDDKTIKSFLLLRKIKRENPKVVFELKIYPHELLSAKEDLVEAYSTLTDNEFRRDILDIIKRNDTEWPQSFLTILKETRATKSHNFIVDELVAHNNHEELQEGFDHLVDRYRNNAENYFWAAKMLLLSPELIEQLGFVRKKLVFNIFHSMDIISKEITNKKLTTQKQNRKLFPQFVDFFTKEDEPFQTAINEMEKNDAKIIMALINGIMAMDEKNRSLMREKLLAKFPDLEKDIVGAATKKELHEFLVTTESFERKQKELQNILNVEIPKNSKAIGIAQEKGDLRENADYIAALEQQKLLQETARKLTEELGRIKIISVNDIDDSSVTVGTHVYLVNLDNEQKEEYTILGEWESNMEQGIISYKSPFGKSLLGFKPDDTVTFDHGGVTKQYKIESIKKAEELAVTAS